MLREGRAGAEELGRVPGGDRGVEGGRKKQKGCSYRKYSNSTEKVCSSIKRYLRFNATGITTRMLERFCKECRIWWALVGSLGLITGVAELSSSPARLAVRAGEGRGVATAPAAAPATLSVFSCSLWS